MKCKLNTLVDKPYGFNYELKDQQLTLIKSSRPIQEANNKPAVGSNPNSTETGRDNRNLLDRSGNQKMTSEDIERLKTHDDLSGNDIIDKLIENSASFNTKTEFSQEKYIKKKKDKWVLNKI
jgi:tRNA (adenine-N(1)-)-methyltransferase non-catalytic subunit